MMDSWSPRKLDPGFAQTYSNPSDLITSTMKSAPVRSAVRPSAPDGTSASAAADIGGGTVRFGSAGGAATAAGAAARAAAPAAAPFRKFLRSTPTLGCFAMLLHLVFAVILHLYHMN